MAGEVTNRRGCGCLSVVGLFLVAVIGIGLLADLVDTRLNGGVIAAVIAGVVVLSAVAGFGRRRRRAESRDDADDGAPDFANPTGPSTAPLPGPAPKPLQPRVTPSRVSPPGPEEPETRLLRRQLSEAVADLSNEIEGRAGSSGPVSSEEMIARAKRRIAEWRD